MTETFVAQELLGLKQLGLKLSLFAMRPPAVYREHPVHREIAEVASYLPENLHREPLRIVSSWRIARKMPGYRTAWRLFLRDFRRDFTMGRIRRFAEAMVLAAEMPDDTGLVYVHFMHSPTSIARYASRMRELPFAISAHARDIWTIPDWEKRDKLSDCQWLVTCTSSNAAHLKSLASDPSRVGVVYHGLDFSRFPPRGGDLSENMTDGRDPNAPVKFLSVGRLVDKKGYEGLFEALGMIPQDLNWRLSIVGGGSLQSTLIEKAKRSGFERRIAFLGSMSQDELLQHYRSADAFVLNCRIAEDGDRDGLPNVLMEAQSQRLICISTDVSAVPELIADGSTGLLVPPDDSNALAKALERTITDPGMRRRLGAAGEAHVLNKFGYAAGVRSIFDRIVDTLAQREPRS